MKRLTRDTSLFWPAITLALLLVGEQPVQSFVPRAHLA